LSELRAIFFWKGDYFLLINQSRGKYETFKNISHLKDGSVDTLGPRETENICSMISKSECIDKCIM
jgi:hypothetical protein